MPLPPGTLKSRTQLETQADNTYKDNGATDLTRTRGVDVRQFIADLLASIDFNTELVINTAYNHITGVLLDKERHYFGNITSLSPVPSTNIVVDSVNCINGGAAKLFSQAPSNPNITYNGFTQVFESFEPYDVSKINVYEFICIKVGSNIYLRAYRYVLNN